MNKRIFVEKRGIFDVESPKVLNEIKSILPNIQSVKVFNIYDIFGLDELEFEKVVNNTFVDPVVDILHHENPAKSIYFATEFLPGQYDQRADSAQQCIALLTGNEKSTVRSGKLIELQGINEADLPKIKNLLINKVESQEKNLEILDEKGYINVDSEKRTPVKGIYAAGDVVKKEAYQIVTATSDGALAAISCIKDIKEV